MTDAPIHLPQNQKRPDGVREEASVVCPVWITQSSLDGIQAILHYCAGVEAAGKGRVPGSFELTMFYRTLSRNIQEHLNK